jgi:hypothetical protein
MEEIFFFTDKPDLEKKILSNLDQVEGRATARLLPRRNIGDLVEAAATKPWGYAKGNGGMVNNSYGHKAESTYFKCAWFSWRKKKFVYLNIYRGNAGQVSYGAGGFLEIDTATDGAKDIAYSLTLPDRHKEYHQIVKRRYIKKSIRHLPPLDERMIDNIWHIYPDVGELVLAVTHHDNNKVLIGTPAGWLQTNKWKIKSSMRKETTSAWIALKNLGFPVPHLKKKRVWNEELTTYLIAHVLS